MNNVVIAMGILLYMSAIMQMQLVTDRQMVRKEQLNAETEEAALSAALTGRERVTREETEPESGGKDGKSADKADKDSGKNKTDGKSEKAFEKTFKETRTMELSREAAWRAAAESLRLNARKPLNKSENARRSSGKSGKSGQSGKAEFERELLQVTVTGGENPRGHGRRPRGPDAVRGGVRVEEAARLQGEGHQPLRPAPRRLTRFGREPSERSERPDPSDPNNCPGAAAAKTEKTAPSAFPLEGFLCYHSRRLFSGEDSREVEL